MNKKQKIWIIGSIVAIILALIPISVACNRARESKQEDPTITISTRESENIKSSSKAKVKELASEVKDSKTTKKTIKSSDTKVTTSNSESSNTNSTKESHQTKKPIESQVSTTSRVSSTTKKQSTSSNSTTPRVTTRSTTRVQSNPGKKSGSISYKTTTESYSIPFKTIDAYASTGSESRVYQAGQSGKGQKTYKVTLKNGSEIDRSLISDVTIQWPQDQIIERYIKTQDAVYESREVDDTSKPVYWDNYIDQWFVRFYDGITGEEFGIKYYDTASEASNAYSVCVSESPYSDRSDNVACNWGTADPVPRGTIFAGYEKKIENVKISDEVWEWKH